MKVYAFVGPSGTGKSTSALYVADRYAIEAIIDDGLLIIAGQKIAGTSAKFEKNTLTAVRRAIFEEPVHQQAVIEALQTYRVQSLLIIGTSVKMIEKIANRLQLAHIDEWLYVEQVRTQKEIQMAKFVRETQGKHVMPIPYRQVEQNFFKRLVQRGKEIFSSSKQKIGETTIVRPDFHEQTIDIARQVYVDVVAYAAMQVEAVVKIEHVHVDVQHLPAISFNVTIEAPVHYDVRQMLHTLQQNVADEFERHFTVAPASIDVFVKGTETKKE